MFKVLIKDCNEQLISKLRQKKILGSSTVLNKAIPHTCAVKRILCKVLEEILTHNYSFFKLI